MLETGNNHSRMHPAKLIPLAILLLGLFLAGPFRSPACTVFCDGQDGTVFAGRSFDIPDNSDLGMAFVPAKTEKGTPPPAPARRGAKNGESTNATHGWVGFGRTAQTFADGMNDAGLFVAVADVPTPYRSVTHKVPPDLKTFVEGLLAHCATVEEAIAWSRKQPTPCLGGSYGFWSLGNPQHPFYATYSFATPQHILVAERTGDSVVLEWVRGRFKAVRKTGRYQLMTNFLLSAPELGYYPCPRFATDKKILDEAGNASLETAVAVLRTTATGITKYSLVCDPVRGEVHVYLRGQFDQPKSIRLADELAKGAHQVALDEWFGVKKPESLAMPAVTGKAMLSGAEILQKALAARGGREAAEGIHSFRAKGTSGWNVNCYATSPAEYFATRSNQWRAVTEQKLVAGQALGRADFGFDGQTGWEMELVVSPEKLTGKRLEQQRDAAAFFAWYDDAARYRSVECVGEAWFEGKKCYVLKLVTLTGREEMHYYDADTFLLAGVMATVETLFGPNLVKCTFGDYREFGGFTFPMRQGYESQWGIGSVQYDSMELNTVTPSAFKLPAELQRETRHAGRTPFEKSP